MDAFYLIICALSILVLFVYYSITKNNDYWKKRGVAHVRPLALVGNYAEYVTFRKHAPLIAQDLCLRFPDEPYVGAFYGTDPVLILQDPELIKTVMAKDFYYFNAREVANYTHCEPITENMFFTGGDRWKVLRQNLTSMFSSSKLKNMFYLIENCATSLETALEESLRGSDTSAVEIKSLLARYTMDCIGSCAFGVSTGTLKDTRRENPFLRISEQLFDVSNYGGFKLLFRAMWPGLFYGLGFQLFDRDVSQFFDKLISGVFESRQFKESSRNDFVDQILSWKRKDHITGDSITNLKTGEKKITKLEVDDELLIGQCALLFAAGFETTSSITSFALYELAKHPHAQERVIEEVIDYFRRHDGKIEFECINEMPYLQACIDETLRLYPVLGVLTREVTEEYTLPTGLVLEKGTRVHIPVYHMHHNPKYFADPEEFRPERFYGEEKKSIKQYTYMPFGEGPRICMGLRFSRMPMMAGLLTVFRRWRVRAAQGTPARLAFQPRSFVTQPLGGLRLHFTPRGDDECHLTAAN